MQSSGPWLAIRGEQSLRFGVTPHIRAHESAPRLDTETIRLGVVERCTDDCRCDSATLELPRNFGVMDSHHIPGESIVQHAELPLYRRLEAAFGHIVTDVDVG